MSIITIFILLVAGYLLGSIPTGYIIGKIVKNIDIREHGSKNLGATNVFRCVGKTAGIITLVIDFLKSFIPVLLTKIFVVSLPGLALWVGIFAIAGHTWPVFLKFKGGKGVATSAGLFFALAPIATLISVILFVFVVYFTRYVSLGSIAAAVTLPIALFFTNHSSDIIILTAIVSGLIIYRHRVNIQRLVHGVENKISFGAR